MNHPMGGCADHPTNGPTDRRTDTPSYRDASTHLKIVINMLLLFLRFWPTQQKIVRLKYHRTGLTVAVWIFPTTLSTEAEPEVFLCKQLQLIAQFVWPCWQWLYYCFFQIFYLSLIIFREEKNKTWHFFFAKQWGWARYTGSVAWLQSVISQPPNQLEVRQKYYLLNPAAKVIWIEQ